MTEPPDSAVPPYAASPLRFQILGPLRAWRGRQELNLGPGKQRAVLAVLLLDANRTVPVSGIIDAVWADDPPENGANVVQKYVAGLRRVLEPDRSPRSPGRTLILTEGGYRLSLPAGSLDVDVLDQRTRAASVARTGGDPAGAAAILRDVLAAWREPALPGLSGPVFDAARTRIGERRATACELWAETELELGRHDILGPELAGLVAEFPVREGLRHLLILALYRSGRQAEALTAFREARRHLVDEYGVEPGEPLQELHRQILRSDPALAAPAPAADLSWPDRPPAAPPPARTPTGYASHPSPGGPRPSLPPPSLYAPQPVPVRWPRLVSKIVMAGLCLASMGFLTWAVMAYLAARRGSWRLGLAALGYFALAVVVLAVVPGDGGPPTWTAAGVMTVGMFSTAVGGAAHAAFVAGPTIVLARPDDVAVREIEARVNRAQALSLLYHHPDIARRLYIGRPDLSRVFDDGGLVDINAASKESLVRHTPLRPIQAEHTVAERSRNGPYASVEDLVMRGVLPIHEFELVRSGLIVIRD